MAVNHTFQSARRGWLGDQPVGADYMADVARRAKRMKQVTKESREDQRQLRLPLRVVGYGK